MVDQRTPEQACVEAHMEATFERCDSDDSDFGEAEFSTVGMVMIETEFYGSVRGRGYKATLVFADHREFKAVYLIEAAWH